MSKKHSKNLVSKSKSSLYFLIFYCFFFSSCLSNNGQTNLPTQTPLPSYLTWVYPPPSSIIQMGDFTDGVENVSNAVCIELRASELLENGDNNFELTDYLERSSLFIDNEELTNFRQPVFVEDLLETQTRFDRDDFGNLVRTESNGVGPYTLCWPKTLSSGVHTIQFVTTTTSGQKFRYQWSFFIR